MGNQACCNMPDTKDAALVQMEAVEKDADLFGDGEVVEPTVYDPSQAMQDAPNNEDDPPEAPPSSKQEQAAGKENDPPEALPSCKQEQGVGIDFDVGGSTKTVTTVRKPLGVVFNKGLPMTVGSLRQGSHAEELGVKPGWVMKAVGGEDVSNMNTAQTLATLQRYTEALPTEAKSVEIVFEGQEKSVIASRRPFGANFEQKVPLTVTRVKEGGHAEKLCVKPGWVVKAIAGQELSSMSFEDAWNVFQSSFESLPQES